MIIRFKGPLDFWENSQKIFSTISFDPSFEPIRIRISITRRRRRPISLKWPNFIISFGIYYGINFKLIWFIKISFLTKITKRSISCTLLQLCFLQIHKTYSIGFQQLSWTIFHFQTPLMTSSVKCHYQWLTDNHVIKFIKTYIWTASLLQLFNTYSSHGILG